MPQRKAQSTKTGGSSVRTSILMIFLCTLFSACHRNNDNSNNQPCGMDSCGRYNNQCYDSADWHITTRVKAALMSDGSLSASGRLVGVVTTNGVVTLTGNVPSKDESRYIERKVKSMDGVRKVDNQLTVSS